MVWLDRDCGHPLPCAFDVASSVPGAQAGVATLGGLVPRAVVRIRLVPVGMTWPELEAVLADPCAACA